MARIFIDGFEHGDLGLWDESTSATAVGDTITGNHALMFTSQLDGRVVKNITSTSNLYVAVRCSGLASFYISLYSTLEILIEPSLSQVSVTVGAAELIDYTASSEGYHIQVCALASGVVQVKVNNILLHDTTWTPQLMTSVEFSAGVGVTAVLDDIVIDDANWPGAPLIYGLTPNADGATNEWTPSTGVDNYATVDEVPPNSTDYVSSTTSGEIDLYEVTNLPDTDVWSVNSVQVSAYAKTPGPPEDEYLQLGVRSGGSNHFGERQQLSTSFAQHYTIFENNPITAAAWTQDEVNSGEFGMKEVS